MLHEVLDMASCKAAVVGVGIRCRRQEIAALLALEVSRWNGRAIARMERPNDAAVDDWGFGAAFKRK